MKIERYLRDKGLPPNIRGFKYLAYMIELCQSDESLLYNRKMTANLYPILKADLKLDISISAIDRDVRYVLKAGNINVSISRFIANALIDLKSEQD